MTGFLYSTFFFLVAIVVLVAIHEFGHFWVARKFGVRIERFSIGMGKPLWTYVSKKDGCEFVVAPIPLGGYVKMYGEQDAGDVDDQDKDKALMSKPVYQRMLIVLAGPFFNFGFAIIALSLFFMIGKPGVPPLVQQVQPGSVASQGGFRPRDLLVAIDGKKIRNWKETYLMLFEGLVDRDELKVTVRDKDGTLVERRLDFRNDRSIIGPGVNVYARAGLVPGAPPRIRTVEPGSPAHKGGLRAGDLVLSVDGRPVSFWREVEERFIDKPNRAVEFVVLREGRQLRLTVTPRSYQGRHIRIGVLLDADHEKVPGARVKDVVKGSPAAVAGVKAGDVIIAVEGKPISGNRQLIQQVQNRANKQTRFSIRRGTRTLELMVEPKLQPPIGLIDAGPYSLQHYGLLQASARGISETALLSRLMLKIFYRMVMGEASLKNISGPVKIGQFAGITAKRNWYTYLHFLALLSVSLGVINLLPIPVLDGGHFMYYTIEAIRGKPVSDKARKFGLYIGIIFILSLMTLAFYNDLAGLFAP